MLSLSENPRFKSQDNRLKNMFHIVVCVKAVPDPEKADSIKIDPATKTLIRKDIPMVLNPIDRFALEAALNIKAERESCISVISMGPPSAEVIIKECMALGADKGYLLSDMAFGGADAFATAFTLAGGIKKLDVPDLILCGMASSDGATEWVGPQIASFLEMPVVTMVNQIEQSDEISWIVKADAENGYRRVSVRLPAVFTVTRELNQPRTLSFSGIIKARKKEVQTWNLEDLGCDSSQVGAEGSPTIVSEMEPAQNVRSCTILTGTREEKVEALFKILEESGSLKT